MMSAKIVLVHEREQVCADNEESSSDESDAAAEVAAARVARSALRDNALIEAMKSRRAVSASSADAQGRSQRRREVVNYHEDAQSQRWMQWS